jgi:NAD(P)-dependent dehydrogenase (short-subunit alcohol dehydrogenase family)
MRHNQPISPGGLRGSVVLVTSTSAYFGTTGVGAYITSKHGLTGLLRASQKVARDLGIGVNAVAPFFTPTPTFRELAEKWKDSGLKSNTPRDVARAIALICTQSETGKCYMVLLTFFILDWLLCSNLGIDCCSKVSRSRR